MLSLIEGADSVSASLGDSSRLESAFRPIVTSSAASVNDGSNSGSYAGSNGMPFYGSRAIYSSSSVGDSSLQMA